MDKNIFTNDGLYVNLKNKNIIERVMVRNDIVTELEPIDYRIDIQNFCDCDLSDFEDEIDRLYALQYSDADEDKLRYIINKCYDIANEINLRNETLGALLAGTFSDIVCNKKLLLEFESRDSLKDAATTLTVRLLEILHIQRKVKNFFPCIANMDILGKYIDELVPKAVLYKSIKVYESGKETDYVFFDYVKYYYDYLMFLFYNRKEAVSECEFCNKYFIPKTKKKTLYCDRVFKDGKTCKEIGPILKHKMLAENDLVLQTYNKEKNKMYKRMERADIYGETPKAITPEEYFAWLDMASSAKNLYLNNELSQTEALEIIITE